nr:unnamed protein product [Callosobruchus analis]
MNKKISFSNCQRKLDRKISNLFFIYVVVLRISFVPQTRVVLIQFYKLTNEAMVCHGASISSTSSNNLIMRLDLIDAVNHEAKVFNVLESVPTVKSYYYIPLRTTHNDMLGV